MPLRRHRGIGRFALQMSTGHPTLASGALAAYEQGKKDPGWTGMAKMHPQDMGSAKDTMLLVSSRAVSYLGTITVCADGTGSSSGVTCAAKDASSSACAFQISKPAGGSVPPELNGDCAMIAPRLARRDFQRARPIMLPLSQTFSAAEGAYAEKHRMGKADGRGKDMGFHQIGGRS